MLAPRQQAFLLSTETGATAGHVNLKDIRRLPLLELPDINQQRKIGKQISAYDDLIENNRRRIQLLERSLHLLYKEWFVHLRFPSHEHSKIVDGIPEGWKKVTVPEIISINPRESLEKSKEVWYVPMASLSESLMTFDITLFQRRVDHTAVKFRNNDVLFARITPCLENGKTAFVDFLENDEVACGSTEFIILRGQKVSSYFTYCLSRSYDFRNNAIKSMIGSSGRQRVQVTCFNDFFISLPPRFLLEQFDDFASRSFHQIKILSNQNRQLQQARDLLLPKLMSGAIGV